MNTSMIKYIAALLLFGSNGIVASLIAMNSYEIVMFRTMLGSCLLIILYLIINKHFTFYHHRKSAFFLLLSGISMGISWLCLYEAYKQIGVGIATLGYYTGPVIVMSISPFLFNEKLTNKKLLCFLTVFFGVLLVNCNAFQESHNFLGILYALLSAVLYVFMVSFNKKAEEIQGLENSTLQLTIAFFSVFIFVMLKQGFHFQIQTTDIVPLIFLGLVNTGIGCFLYFSSIGHLKVQTVAILGYLEPLSAIFFSFLFLKEQLLPLQIIGAICIIAGAICAEI